MGMTGETMNTVKSWSSKICNKDDKDGSVPVLQDSGRKKVNGHRYKELLKSQAKKAKGSDPSVQEKDKLSHNKVNVTEAHSSKKDETKNADSSTPCSKRERVDFVLRRASSSDHAQRIKSSDCKAQTKRRKYILSESSSDLDISMPEEKLTHFVADEFKSSKTTFVEYWVPVRLSNVQTEQYCGSIFSNLRLLCSSSNNDSPDILNDISGDILNDILISTRKCCDHPYLVNGTLRTSLIQGIPVPEQLDAEIKLSSKLLLLHKILTEIKKRGLRVLILYQTLGGSELITDGDILDDIIHHKFGEDSYVRIDGRGPKFVSRSKKKDVLNTFNDKGSGKFVCLMETRSCHPSTKLASIDVVIFFNSDWDPMNDLRALQKINLDSQFEQVKVFRLYSLHTVEEKVLVLAKQGISEEGNMKNMKQSTCQGLLTWGASHLFKKLDEFHNSSTQDADSVISCGDSFVEDVFRELSTLLPNSGNNNDTIRSSFISKAQMVGGIYPRSISLLGELESPQIDNFSVFEEMIDKERVRVFWTNLLEGRKPRWRYFSCPSPRTRTKVVQHFPDSSGEESASKKRREEVKHNVDQIPPIRRRKRNRLQCQDTERKCPGGRKFRRRHKDNCVSLDSDKRGNMASWIFRQTKAATPLTSNECAHAPASTALHPPVVDSVRLTEDVREPRATSHEIPSRDSGNIRPPEEASQVTHHEALQSVCTALTMELEKLQDEKIQNLKLHEDMKLQTKMACDKEIDEIRKKYDMVLQNAEMAFVEKKDVIECRYKKVFINKTFAEMMIPEDDSTNATLLQVDTNSLMEEIYQQIVQLTGPTAVKRPHQLTENLTIPISNQASSLARIPSRSNLYCVNPSLTVTRPATAQAVTRFDQLIGNSRAGYKVRSPAPHLRHMRPPRPVTTPSTVSTGVIFSPVSLRQVPNVRFYNLLETSDAPLLYLMDHPYED